ncbi:4825_t:CDS:2 [Paraglomus occultum]|uniref:4825_t:CDS:1 n=1 Tax=Paraglomus occultum TaxID=144539 RepID=A0A9N9BPW6_9GLOM|nr:4825_t:CDS:2 [Paraglomus occultum]
MSKWSSQEDAAVINLYDVYGAQWTIISNILQTKTAQQCSQRWRNALRLGINKRPLTASERETVKRLYRVHGPRWNRISLGLPDRTPNMVKTSFQESQAEEKRIRAQMSVNRLLNWRC